MRTAMLAMLALAMIVPGLGCAGARSACGSCNRCDNGHGCIRNGAFARHFGPSTHATPTEEGMGAPQGAQVAYPYYTTRGPRDFFQNNPASIGN
jgi:hypothetical protein